MKRLIAALVLASIAFSSGLFGMYRVMPVLSPERVAAALPGADSTAVAAVHGSDPAAPTHDPELDAPAHDEATPARPLSHLPTDSVRSIQDAALAMMGLSRDSLDALAQRARRGAAPADPRKSAPAGKKEEPQISAEALGSTLARLDDDYLMSVVQHMDLATLRRVYLDATEKNRTRLLQAMPPDQAARFVQEALGSKTGAQNARSRTAPPAANTRPAADTHE